MVAVLAGGIYLPPDHPDTGMLRQSATMQNPDYAKHRRLVSNGRVPAGAESPPKQIKAWNQIPDGEPWAGGTILPRRVCPPPPKAISGGIADRRSEGAHIEAAVQFTLRDYQKAAVASLLREGDALVVAPCGAGKTAIGIGSIAALGRTTLILVHTLDLQQQWLSRLKTDLIGGFAPDVQVSTIQSLYRMPWPALYEWGKRFGLVILDEAHHAPAMSFSRVLNALPSRWRLGLTATPDRDDGLTPILRWHFGKKPSYTVDHAMLVAGGHLLVPGLHVVNTGWEPADPEANWSAIMAGLVSDPDRNRQISSIVNSEVAEGRQVLVLSDRVAHCEQLAESCAGEALVGRKSISDRNSIMERALKRETMVITATSVADEGLDLPSLDTVVLATPTKALGRLQQRVGRIMRPQEGKQPRIYDLVDGWGPLIHQYKRRKSLYWRLGITQSGQTG